jgi:hypothetical protein
MEPFYEWQSRHEASTLSSVVPLIIGITEGAARQQAQEKTTRRFKQLTLVDAICTALLS